MRCRKYPRYRAVFRPRVECPECWDLYLETHKEETT